ncbi:MAG: FAD-dependent oxidoreductase [Deltaproteobacteria bacterium]|jgi:NADPH-dependent 2,4-dienoyl-CoA reductase/sulfur reductase-like enzyme/rhodanese-related sulfurtransferase|nr:FAD-dependent oxidoreductase [Deltaproteobacteria bacterium]
MPERIIIIGAVALGPKVACRLKRLNHEAEITLIDKDTLISYGGCGIPYYIGGDIADLEGLYSTFAHAIRDKEFFRTDKGVKALTGVEALSINRKEKKLLVRHLNDKIEEELEYDKLVIATGATPVKPPFPGVDLSGVHVISNLHHALAIKTSIADGKVGHAVVIGAGAIGIEMAEALTDLWGVETTLIEMADHVLPAALGKNISAVVEKELRENDINVLLSQRVVRINGDKDNRVTSVETTETTISCDMVVLAAGVRPNSEIAKDAGLAIGRYGGILVDPCMQTTDPDIYAGGDCVEVKNIINGQSMLMPLGSLANRQGRIIATNINGGCEHFKGAVGSFCIKVFGLGVAKAGLTFEQAKSAGFDPIYSMVAQSDRAHFYPDSDFMYIKLIADRNSRKILGIEAAGPQGDAVKARVDAVAPLFQYGATISDICSLEVAYAPPYASAMDIINNAANCLDNTVKGSHVSVDVQDFLEEFRQEKTRVLDIRSKIQAEPFVKKYGERWINIPQDEFRARVQEVPTDEPLCLLCGSGPRSYEIQVILAAHGITNTRNIQGGYAMILAVHGPLD